MVLGTTSTALMGTPVTKLGLILREEGRKQSWLARRLGVDESVVSRWVHGHRVPDDMRPLIAEALSRKRSEIFDEEPAAA